MNEEPLDTILELDGEERFDYFLDTVIEERDIWILVNGDNRFLKIVSDDDVAYLPVWPSEAFAAHYAGDTDNLSPKRLTLPEFFNKWVPGLTKDGLDVGVFPGTDDTLWIMSPADLKKDLQDEMASL
ncbi:DUF2750 domain-containing protein [Marinobacter halodurans]|uniref:DUF2750 domain-containing protein n=1 Tax=Marinobacter halodurans TaxID=2528979 RepID=A0ABY1ZI13_9GAMM|nr:DUF2750 domain-containing protein [Marinobacter halodurans]TBW49390.1 DUF2750 domain-containing protein [Marinobacter halodurans]